ncbi:D-alanyl-D-alanine-carboxypeptidase/endopeptidase AmpH [Paracoccus sp. SCSIO 75233]|uniref:D-alanyl-D-alanine- carboxypeptidase/endopeptidase AmpH n=1 Tax=Paracoccus sp. SCSIO 75233 TaxID=3017782 RepID=UPI0022F0948B|nr:D-alanyl-D-alanine-carboxypeptidase/endopeptidase AmpH [Paracoccus sp. SCSIO 75233]WBU54104.1 D-alanyl-D-alanine-carboxypeptidase/endopeptidase AmpH [Paracoccus sp. SCSIO 75233]
MQINKFLRRAFLPVLLLAHPGWSAPAQAQSALLDDTVSFTGQVLFLETGVPGLVIGAVQGGQRVVFGFGETRRGNGETPDGDTQMRVGSITKVFTGAVLADMAAEGSIGLTDTLASHLPDIDVPRKGDRPIRLIDLATHTSGLPRELEREVDEDDPFSTITLDAYFAALSDDKQLFPAGTGGLYSNFGFDMLAAALGGAAGEPYPTLLQKRILDPLGLDSTGFAGMEGRRMMSGHGFDGEALPDVPSGPAMAGASGLYSTANDILTWLEWHLDEGDAWAETRLLDHAPYVNRDGLSPVFGFDESGEMDAMALGWIVMQPDGNRPLILQKAGGLQGMFLYHAFAPSGDIGVFVAVNQFDFAASALIAQFANDLITQLAAR